MLGKQSRKMEPCRQPDGLGIGSGLPLKGRRKVVNMMENAQGIRSVSKGKAVEVGMAIFNPDTALPRGRQDGTCGHTRKEKTLKVRIFRSGIFMAFRVYGDRKELRDGWNVRTGLADGFISRFLGRPAAPEPQFREGGG